MKDDKKYNINIINDTTTGYLGKDDKLKCTQCNGDIEADNEDVYRCKLCKKILVYS